MQKNKHVPQQIPLDLGHRTAMGREDFMIAPSNEAAVAWIDRWPNWPAPTLIIYGPDASGKTHLTEVWQTQSNCFDVIENVDQWIGKAEEEADLFHKYNLAKENKTYFLLTASTSPQNWDFTLPDLASRLKAAPNVEIQPPDDTLLAAMLIKLFHDRQLAIKEDVVKYILPRIERSYTAAAKLAAKADKAALSKKSGITIPLVSELL